MDPDCTLRYSSVVLSLEESVDRKAWIAHSTCIDINLKMINLIWSWNYPITYLWKSDVLILNNSSFTYICLVYSESSKEKIASTSPVCNLSGPLSNFHWHIRANPCLGKRVPCIECPWFGNTKGIPPRIGFLPSNTERFNKKDILSIMYIWHF